MFRFSSVLRTPRPPRRKLVRQLRRMVHQRNYWRNRTRDCGAEGEGSSGNENHDHQGAGNVWTAPEKGENSHECRSDRPPIL